jgi:hypothetical protein
MAKQKGRRPLRFRARPKMTEGVLNPGDEVFVCPGHPNDGDEGFAYVVQVERIAVRTLLTRIRSGELQDVSRDGRGLVVLSELARQLAPQELFDPDRHPG